MPAPQCLELDYRKPTAQQVAARMSLVCQREGLQLNDATLKTLIEGAQGDLRLVLGQLQVRHKLACRGLRKVVSLIVLFCAGGHISRLCLFEKTVKRLLLWHACVAALI